MSRTHTRTESVAVVVVTYNRADLLERMLEGLAGLDRAPDAVYVVDNASTDHTREVLAASTLPGLVTIRSTENLGGAGGFRLGLRTAFERGHDAMWLMDDDVVPAPDCLTRLLEVDGSCLAAVREDRSGALVEKAAVRFDLRNPLAIRPKTASVDSTYPSRAAMPATVPVENVAFEGFLVRREVVETIGLPDASFFIFYDDVDYAIRARRAGFPIVAVRDAVLVRQLEFDQQHDLAGWKGYYMYRNLFVVHFRYGENALVRAKPWLLAAVVVLLSPLRGGRAEARNVVRALRDARRMRTPPAR
ncbi:glycosyltransferase family 2 protein [Nocardioides sp. zg-536]|uniref:Glycosyltransferase family 2 protein n=1 Tax=Nocardioides faecalis TaxID=2803858 RepID=A0A938Y4Y3_9ACTN|nr:glycosyltransferase family 2 protein [Nocardioides faecalis]MBM9459335.1 glycosyltransferase family 2 protein [Nocardioides faecalis]QVI59547.1 glycosyltransferase family 2 protein [Nocardioides faecalis]